MIGFSRSKLRKWIVLNLPFTGTGNGSG